MKKAKLSKLMSGAAAAALTAALVFTGCSAGGTSSTASASSTATAALQTLDFSTLMTSFTKGSLKSDNWDRTNVVPADTTTTATIAAPSGETKPVIMLKGNPGTFKATSSTAGTLTTDPTKNSYLASALLLKGGSPAQYGDGIFKFKEKVSSPTSGVWNTMMVFRDSNPQKALSDDSVTKALAIVTYGGDVQIQKNYKNSSGAVVKQELVKDTGVKIGDGKYHYFILAMQDVSSGTNTKLWIDGNVAYSGVITGITGQGAIEAIHNSTPMYDSNNKILTAKDHTGALGALTACAESYYGGYDDGPAVATVALDPVK